MKICTKCKKEKSYTEFSKRTRASDGHNSWCKLCYKLYEQDRYQNGDSIRKRRNAKNATLRNKDYIKQLLESSSCVDCGDSDWWNLEFDHRELGTKTKNVNYLMQHASIQRIKDEIKLCDIRCLKCHRKRTIVQLGWWRGKEFDIGK